MQEGGFNFGGQNTKENTKNKRSNLLKKENNDNSPCVNVFKTSGLDRVLLLRDGSLVYSGSHQKVGAISRTWMR